MFNLRFAHFPSRTPIMLELQVDPNTTVGQLRALVEEKLATEDHCLVRVFARWYLETRAGEVRRFSELTDADGGSLLSAVGIEDECELYLEGPQAEEKDEMRKALAIVSMQSRQAQAAILAQTAVVHSLLNELSSLKQTQTLQDHHLRSLRKEQMEATTSQKQTLDTLGVALLEQKEQIKAMGIGQAKQQQQLDVITATQAEQFVEHFAFRRAINAFSPPEWNKANSLLQENPDMPLKALWDILVKDEDSSSVELAMSIVMDWRCGLERKTTGAEGEMESWDGLVLNKQGGLTPLIMATLAGHLDFMRSLLAAGVSVNAWENEYCHTSLHVAAITDNTSAIELLVSYGAHVNTKESSPLHCAAYNGHLEAIEMLIDKGADIKATDHDGETPLKKFEKNAKEIKNMSLEEKDRVRKLLLPKSRLF